MDPKVVEAVLSTGSGQIYEAKVGQSRYIDGRLATITHIWWEQDVGGFPVLVASWQYADLRGRIAPEAAQSIA